MTMSDFPKKTAFVVASPAQEQKNNPLHGLTLEAIVIELVETYGWDELGKQIPIHCFAIDPSIKSSLNFLRKTPWAREKVESLYLFVQREKRRQSSRTKYDPSL